MNQNYFVYEKAYQELKESGYQGWGAETYSKRMSEWNLTIRELMLNPNFPKAPAQLLEIGCGAGDVTFQFANHGYIATGIEISTTAVNWAKEKSKEHPLAPQFFQGDVVDLSIFDDKQFDIIIDGNCFHCVIGDNRKKTLSEIRRILTEGGVFHISSMVGDPKQGKAHLKFDPVTRCQIQNGVPYRYMAKEEDLLSEVSDAGFSIIESKISHNTWWDHMTCIARKI